jgi:hypothetical protein
LFNICSSFEIMKSILFWPQDLPSVPLFHCPTSVVSMLYNLHFWPPYWNPLPKVHFHFVHNILASIVLVSEFQIPCICMVWAYSHWLV